jgi:hypothetical protein
LSLTAESASHFIGGQAKIFNEREHCIYQGEISDIELSEYSLILRFSWLATKDDLFSENPKWRDSGRNNHPVHLSFFSLRDHVNGQLLLVSKIVEEAIVLLPKGHPAELAMPIYA